MKSVRIPSQSCFKGSGGGGILPSQWFVELMIFIVNKKKMLIKPVNTADSGSRLEI
jgi:hypothetical protein